MEYPKDKLFEKLADIEHQRWAGWQKYMHSNCIKVVELFEGEKAETLKEVTIPVELFNQWERQINTPYSKLSEKEKDSDRDQVMRYWKLIKN